MYHSSGQKRNARRDHEIWRISQKGSAGSKMDLLKIINLLRQAGQYLFESRITPEEYSIKIAHILAFYFGCENSHHDISRQTTLFVSIRNRRGFCLSAWPIKHRVFLKSPPQYRMINNHSIMSRIL